MPARDFFKKLLQDNSPLIRIDVLLKTIFENTNYPINELADYLAFFIFDVKENDSTKAYAKYNIYSEKGIEIYEYQRYSYEKIELYRKPLLDIAVTGKIGEDLNYYLKSKKIIEEIDEDENYYYIFEYKKTDTDNKEDKEELFNSYESNEDTIILPPNLDEKAKEFIHILLETHQIFWAYLSEETKNKRTKSSEILEFLKNKYPELPQNRRKMIQKLVSPSWATGKIGEDLD